MKPQSRISVIEIAVLVGALATVVAILLPAIASTGPHCGGRQLKDATQIRGIHQAMVMWANEHHDAEPQASPERSDTVAPGAAK